MRQKLSLGKYPYTYARVSVLRASLITKEDYDRLMKMSLSEIISYLQSSEYKAAIDEYGVKYSGVELMEMALNKNLVDTWNKLKRISSNQLGVLIKAYLARADLWNVKTILRGIHTKASAEEITAMLLPAGVLSSDTLQSLIASDSVEDFLKKLGPVKVKYENMHKEFETFKSKGSTVEIENFIDKTYYTKMLEFSKSIPTEGKLFKQFLETEIEMLNIMNILRLRRAGLNKKEIQPYIIGTRTPIVNKLIEAENKEEIIQALPVSENATKTYSSTNSLIDIEVEFSRKLLQKTRLLLHQHPLTVDVILGYMFA